MHIILSKYVNELNIEFEFSESRESKLFEYFCNYCVVSKKYLGRFNPKNITTEEDDASIDGLAFIIDGELIYTKEDAEQLFLSHKNTLNVDVIITQIKSGEKFEKEEISNFLLGIKDFLTLSPQLPNGELNQNAIEILNVIFNNLRKIKNKRPNISIYYCTSGVYNEERELKATFNIIETEVVATDLFYEINVTPLGRSELLKIWTANSEKNERKLKIKEYFGMPKMPGIPQSYVALVSAKEFVEKLLDDDNGFLKEDVFDENIRAFLGKDNEVNIKIQETLLDQQKKDLFSVLNNGITVIAPEMTLTPNQKEIDLVNYQIINGCQTSNTLFANKDQLTENVNIVIKFIESPFSENVSDIITATNNQTNIGKEAFHSLKDKAKLVQKYFDVKNDSCSYDSKVYFERRENEYKNYGFQATRIFDLETLCRAYNAMFLDEPHISSRFVAQIFAVKGEQLFKQDDQESVYYCSALTYYKYNALINSRRIDAFKYRQLIWHVIYIFKFIVHRKVESHYPNSKKIDKYCEKIISVLTDKDRNYESYFQTCHQIIDILPFPTRDSLKRGKYTNDLMVETEKYLKNNY